MELTIYKIPPHLDVWHDSIPEGAHITVTDAKKRVYFHSDVVEKFKMLSYPPTFAITENGDWAVCFSDQTEHAFPLIEYRGTFYFCYSDFVNRILKKYGKRRVYMTLEETSLPHVFLLKEFNAEEFQEQRKKQYKKDRKFLTDIDTKKNLSYYERLVQGVFE